MASDKDEVWSRLVREGARMADVHLTNLFAQDPNRFETYSRRVDDLLVDFSKERIDPGVMSGLCDLARAYDVEAYRDRMFSGQPVNWTEKRAVLHAALRGGVDPDMTIDGEKILDNVRNAQTAFLEFAEDVRTNRYPTVDGRAFSDVVSIGIGGSDLGPVLAVRALSPDADGPRIHFISNIDGAHLSDVLQDLEPKRTLVIVASKTFTTLETMANARSARAWLQLTMGDQANHNMVAVSTNLEATTAFGIDPSRVFGFWDWVGGRYSVWSAVGLPLALAIGRQRFQAFLDGAASMDRHFMTASLEENIPILMALIGVWRRNIMGWPMVAVIPYDQRLERLPAYLQQMDMESNGKRISRTGAVVERATGPVIWGEPGTNAQHSFFQLLHQGTDIVPVDFILAANTRRGIPGHHPMLMANCLAQSQALAFGRDEENARRLMREEGLSEPDIDRLAAHRTFPGNRPSTSILYQSLNPYSFGRLVALYEHKVFVQSVIWEVNSFDQWGVELGKQLALPLLSALNEEKADLSSLDASSKGLIQILQQMSQQND